MKFGHSMRRVGVAAALVLASVAATVSVAASPASAAPPVADGVYAIVNVNSGMCLGTNGFNPGTVITQSTCLPGTGILQRWRFRNLNGADAYEITVWAGGLCLSIGGSRVDNGAGAVQWRCAGIADQTWHVGPSGAGLAFVNANSRKCLAIGASSTSPGAWAIQWTCVGAPDQQWVLRPV